MSNWIDLQHKPFIYFNFGVQIILFLTFIGIGLIRPDYLSLAQNILKYYISLFLIIRFNPWNTTQSTVLDRRVAFSSGMLLLSTTAIHNYFITRIKLFANIN